MIVKTYCLINCSKEKIVRIFDKGKYIFIEKIKYGMI